MDILIKFYNSWGEFWEAFPLFTLLAIYVVFVCIHKIQNIRRSKGGKHEIQNLRKTH